VRRKSLPKGKKRKFVDKKKKETQTSTFHAKYAKSTNGRKKVRNIQKGENRRATFFREQKYEGEKKQAPRPKREAFGPEERKKVGQAGENFVA